MANLMAEIACKVIYTGSKLSHAESELEQQKKLNNTDPLTLLPNRRAFDMRLKEEIDANIKVLTGDTTYTSADRGLLADFSARLYDTEAIRKLKTE